ncbi:MAG: DUF2306 domain-containing protein [Planctomycetota bacterium]|nr:DUF2306 domain-containing protein [Planctomycetota bacterium]
MTVRSPARRIPQALLMLFFAATTALVIESTLPYFTLGGDAPFLLEKADVYRSVLWRACFYVHVTSGLVCLVAALPQFSKTLLRRAPRLHRALGWTYVVSVLGFAAPAGMYMAVFAKGGMAGRFGFLVLGAVFFYTTWRGLERVRARDFRGHVPWMIRSYAMAASALTFRVFFILLHAVDVAPAYVASIWLSFVVNLAVAELLIRFKQPGMRARPALRARYGVSR